MAGGIDGDGRDRVAAIGQGLVGRDAPGIIGIGDALADDDRRGAARRLGVERDPGVGLVGRADEVGLDDFGDIVGVRCTGIAGRVELAGDRERYVGDVRGVGDREGQAVMIMDVDGDRVMADAAVDARVGVGMRPADEKRRARPARLRDGAGRVGRAIAPVDRDIVVLADGGRGVAVGERGDRTGEDQAFGRGDRRLGGGGDQPGDGRRGAGRERNRPQEALGLAVDPGGEVKRARGAARAAVAEDEAPQAGVGDRPIGAAQRAHERARRGGEADDADRPVAGGGRRVAEAADQEVAAEGAEARLGRWPSPRGL